MIVPKLNVDIRNGMTHWNENPRPYVWTKTADQILDSPRSILSTNL